jgi:hypothetical protein
MEGAQGADRNGVETMSKYTNAEIAASLNLWNDYFNVDGTMTDEEFFDMDEEERLEMLNKAFPA